jgi:hypothetical protein
MVHDLYLILIEVLFFSNSKRKRKRNGQDYSPWFILFIKKQIKINGQDYSPWSLTKIDRGVICLSFKKINVPMITIDNNDWENSNKPNRIICDESMKPETNDIIIGPGRPLWTP